MRDVPNDFVELIRFLNGRSVEYLIAGGYAISWHCCPRFIGELELFVNPAADNLTRIVAALDDFGASGLGIAPADLCDPGAVITLGYPPERIVLFSSMDGIGWNEAWTGKASASLAGEAVWYIGRRELVRTLRATGGAKNLEDAEKLETPAPGRICGASSCPVETGIP